MYNIFRKHSDESPHLNCIVATKAEARQVIKAQIAELAAQSSCSTRISTLDDVTNIKFIGAQISWSIGYWFEKVTVPEFAELRKDVSTTANNFLTVEIIPAGTVVKVDSYNGTYVCSFRKLNFSVDPDDCLPATAKERDAYLLGEYESLYDLVHDQTRDNPFFRYDTRWQKWENGYRNGQNEYSKKVA